LIVVLLLFVDDFHPLVDEKGIGVVFGVNTR
jgi:hypothetical protein